LAVLSEMPLSDEMKACFLLSLPRSGSTLLQRILAAHREIETVSEPHLLLPLVYTTRMQGVYSEYNHKLASMAIEDFSGSLRRGRLDYFSEMRKFVLALYRDAAKGEGSYFLDKTPRYSLIVGEIMEIFPEGKFLFLWRNPLAVISSVLEQSQKGRWQLYGVKVDLFKGLVNLVDAYRKNPASCHSVRYEDLIREPAKVCDGILSYLGLSADAECVVNFDAVKLEGRLGDKIGSGQYRSITPQPLDKWKRTLSNPLRKVWCRRYLKWLGEERLAIMGYSLNSLIAELDGIPASRHMLLSDLCRMPLDLLYLLLEPRLLLEKFRLLSKGRKLYVHY
jgi:hypothetical protein